MAVEPVPFTADTLLSSSFRLNDQSIMVGGKETETYGIDVPSGKVLLLVVSLVIYVFCVC